MFSSVNAMYYVRTDRTISPIETARMCESWKLKNNNNKEGEWWMKEKSEEFAALNFFYHL